VDKAGIPVPLIPHPTWNPAVDGIPVMILEPAVRLPVVGLVSVSTVDPVPVALAEMWICVDESTLIIVEPAGIPDPATTQPTWKPDVESNPVMIGEPEVTFPPTVLTVGQPAWVG
jgi:hypothetical protein